MSARALSLNDASRELLRAIRASGISPQDCYQCGRCSSGCPIQPHFDLKTMAVVKLAALGVERPLMRSRAIWLCAGCETCTTRCPNDIDIAGLMDLLREYSLRRGYRPAEPRIAAFHRTYLDVIRHWGRVFEVELFAVYKLRSRDFLGDLGMGMKMFMQGKLGLRPHRIRDRSAIRLIYRQARAAREAHGGAGGDEPGGGRGDVAGARGPHDGRRGAGGDGAGGDGATGRGEAGQA
ncbi:MAG: 4Fe-4S dicluster domain-containing protein [Candidatus Eisenbacteria bacterium]|uniref:4Fe-4S dicluster domain-containing protein n=1 Tax=Eiseniibacteriota bacterium TaxID=2212470 RepID=A0A937XBP2_UNCEI|nr:4Fe-4S dicluster domain-containing protein [Candidatus Eisenbacteria bacterium]